MEEKGCRFYEKKFGSGSFRSGKRTWQGGEVLKKVIAGVVILAVVAAGVVGYHSYTNREIHVAEIDNKNGQKTVFVVDGNEDQKEIRPPEVPIDTIPEDQLENGEVQLTALADTQEEAEKIAELYGIELKAYSYGVATYTTEEDPEKIIAEGMEKGYPTLAVDQKIYLDKE